MELEPSIDQLLKQVDSKYTMVVAAAKRARQLNEGKLPTLDHPRAKKSVGIALEELAAGNLHFQRPRHGIK